MNDTERSVTARVGHHLLVGALAATAAVGASSAAAELDVFLKLGDIKGESKDDKHKAEIDVLAWSWGVSGASIDSKGKLQPACAQLLSVEKHFDQASPPLATAAALNTTIPTGKLTVRHLGPDQLEYLVIDFTGLTVKALANGGPASEDPAPEKLTLGFTSATISYKPQLDNGGLGAAVTATVPGSCP
jgi:type VI secretion system secreted protein Hcp